MNEKEPTIQTETEPVQAGTTAEPSTKPTQAVQADSQTKIYETALRKVLGLKDDEEFGDIDKRITDLNQRNADIVQNAKNSIISSAIKALQGYDTKLLSKVIDLSGVEVDENGSITGLDEAVKTAETEYPAVLLPKETKTPFVPVNPAGSTQAKITMNDLIRGKF